MPNPETKYKRSKIIFSVTSVAFTVVHICTELLQLSAQSLIGSPVTLGPASVLLEKEGKIPESINKDQGREGYRDFSHAQSVFNLEQIDFFTQFQLRSRSAARALRCRDSKRWAIGNYFSVRI